jgi:hypothetical protein
VKEKATARFECELNRQVPDIKWLKSGLEIKHDDIKYRIFNEGTKSILEVIDCQLEDIGDYSISVRGRKSNAKLNVDG